MRRKIKLFSLVMSMVLLLTAFGKQAQNSSVVVNQQASVADVLQQGITAAENGAASGEETTSQESVAAVDTVENGTVSDESALTENTVESAAVESVAVTETSVLPTEIPVLSAETSLPSIVPAGGEEKDDGVDIDLTKLSSTMVYAEVYSMLSTPRN